MKKKADRFLKYKGYVHFDHRCSPRLAYGKVTDPKWVCKHGFFPFLHYDIKTYSFDQEHPNKPKIKKRPIHYAAHIDRYIYQYYGYLLNQKYNTYAQAHGFDHAAIAYRTNTHNTNIHFARQAFSFLTAHKESDWFVIIADFSKYFPSIDHANLKTCLQTVIGVAKLPEDWFKVFKSLTKYSAVDLEQVCTATKQKRAELHSATRLVDLLSWDAIKKMLVTNECTYGIPQGAPMSGVLANINLINFDQTINAQITGRGGLYLRYSDDIFIAVPLRDSNSTETLLSEETRKIPHLEIQPDKTRKYTFSGGKVTKAEQISQVDFLGFSFNGQSVRIRQKTIFKYHSKLHHVLSLAKVRSKKAGRLVLRKHVYRQFSHIGRKQNNSSQKRRWGNFLTYVERAAKIFDDPKIKKQLRHHWEKIQKSFQIEFDP